ncbi:acetoacetate decarboxylase [Amycolatopsis sp. NPDC051372]|uniref:acetoacetate decarboxylase n=1 Tax=Amycolatopsis sp. NPDC051372 TaxID=3155669 RepID=UPI0034361FEC
MREDEVLAQLTTPLAAPAFPRGPYRFTDREYLNITYRTDPVALRALVPEPLVVDEPLVRFEVMRMPDVTGLGDYTESGQVAMVRHGDEAGEFTLGMYVDSLPAIASGREVAAYPKKLGKPRLYTDSDTLVGSLAYGSIQVALATMGYKHRTLDEAQARAELTAPTFMLKIVPGYDGRPRICELARSRISDVTIKGAWTGPARLHLVAHALAPLADLPVLEIVSASHLLTDLTLGRLAVVHDYLA